MSGREGEVVVLIALVLLLAVAPIIVAARLAERRGRSVWFGIVLAFVLGWIGVLVVLLSGRRAEAPSSRGTRTRPCPACGDAMPASEGTCAGCGMASPAWTMHGGHWWLRDEDGEWRYLDDSRGAWVSPDDGSARDAVAETAETVGPAAGEPTVVGIDHVQVAAPAGREFDVRRFYSGLLGLEEIDKPPALAARGGCWFRAGAQELHVVVAENLEPAAEGPAALRLRSAQELEDVAERLVAAGYEVAWADEPEIPGARRFHVHDPFGNRIELLA